MYHLYQIRNKFSGLLWAKKKWNEGSVHNQKYTVVILKHGPTVRYGNHFATRINCQLHKS
jgi:hypothetical protein